MNLPSALCDLDVEGKEILQSTRSASRGKKLGTGAKTAAADAANEADKANGSGAESACEKRSKGDKGAKKAVESPLSRPEAGAYSDDHDYRGVGDDAEAQAKPACGRDRSKPLLSKFGAKSPHVFSISDVPKRTAKEGGKEGSKTAAKGTPDGVSDSEDASSAASMPDTVVIMKRSDGGAEAECESADDEDEDGGSTQIVAPARNYGRDDDHELRGRAHEGSVRKGDAGEASSGTFDEPLVKPIRRSALRLDVDADSDAATDVSLPLNVRSHNAASHAAAPRSAGSHDASSHDEVPHAAHKAPEGTLPHDPPPHGPPPHGPPPHGPAPFAVGAPVFLLAANGGRLEARVLAVHTDDPPECYYTVRVEDSGAERQQSHAPLLTKEALVQREGAAGAREKSAHYGLNEDEISLGGVASQYERAERRLRLDQSADNDDFRHGDFRP